MRLVEAGHGGSWPRSWWALPRAAVVGPGPVEAGTSYFESLRLSPGGASHPYLGLEPCLGLAVPPWHLQYLSCPWRWQVGHRAGYGRVSGYLWESCSWGTQGCVSSPHAFVT